MENTPEKKERRLLSDEEKKKIIELKMTGLGGKAIATQLQLSPNSVKTFLHRHGKDSAFPIKEASAKREGYDKTTVKGQIEFTDEYPGCPYCGGHQLTVCSCGHIGCTHTSEGVYRCEWCGTTGQIGDLYG